MPKAKDLTHDLVHLRNRGGITAQDQIHDSNQRERPMALNPWEIFFWTLVIGFMGVQVGFIFWLV